MPAAKKKKPNLVFPFNETIDREDLIRVIREAEKGPFYTLEEVKQSLKKWSKKYSKLD